MPPASISCRATPSMARASPPARTSASACLRAPAEVVRLRELLGKRPGREGARAVGAVAVDRGARVHDRRSRSARSDALRVVVRHRGIRAARDDRRRMPAASAPSSCSVCTIHQATSAPSARRGSLRPAPVHRVVHGRGSTNRVQLLRLLDRADPLERRRGRHELDAALPSGSYCATVT